MRTLSKNILIAIFTVLSFSILVLLSLEREISGPLRTGNIDDLKITKAYFNEKEKRLILVSKDGWWNIDIEKVLECNQKYGFSISAEKGNMFFWNNRKKGNPPIDFSNYKEVMILTNTYASFSLRLDGYARYHNKEKAIIPDGYDYALFITAPVYKKRTSDWFTTYLFLSRNIIDHKKNIHGTTILFHPNYKYFVGINSLSKILLFGFSLAGLIISLFVTFNNFNKIISIFLYILSALLHGFSSFILFFSATYWRSVSASTERNIKFYFIFGLIILVVLGVIRFRKKEIQSR